MALQKNGSVFVPLGPPVGRMRYAPTTGYVQSFKIPMLFPNRVRAALRKTVPSSSPSRPSVGRIQYAPTTGYVQSFKIPMLFPNWVCAILQKMDMFSPPSGPLMGRIQCAPTTGYVQFFKIPMLFPNRIRVVLLKNCPVFVSFGTVCGAYSIRPYDWIRAALRKTVLFSSPTGPLVGRIQYAPTTGYVWLFEIPM